ncbi:SDR family oxidoreductase [Burkholderia pyrrocinia]|uniref:SDR family oxidoreductase n=1 Tax=Burkholderia pyrrocinia TaxID=60550 RepID=UPI001FB1FAF1|nr:SDR family oxidoreductase [Burkholderia pyrrocinia]UOB59157.1 SDR family oxidoreductase [Burkholderia pyrrocinia]
MRTDALAFTARAIAAYRSSSSSTRSVLVAPKAANEALVKGLAREEGRCNVRANSILVGVIEAGMFPVLLEQGQFDQAWIDETQKMLALKRWGKAHARLRKSLERIEECYEYTDRGSGRGALTPRATMSAQIVDFHQGFGVGLL